jgi:Tol biopolymer transport system component
MKKTMLFVAACLMSLAASAQVLEVVSMQQLPIAAQADMKVAGISPAGDYILLTTGSNQGLQRYDLESQALTTITDAAGAGYNVQVSNNGQEVVYRETTIDRNNLRQNKVVRLNMYNQRQNVVARGQRDMKHMATSDNLTSVSIKDRLIVLKRNGLTTTLAPNGMNESYIWPSVSPDGSKICYYVCGNGCWVANIDGSNPQYIGHGCQAAKWYDNNTLVAMATEDDGHFTTASAIVLYTLDGKKQTLTNDSMIAMYPYAAENAIVFSTIEGETYLLNVK